MKNPEIEQLNEYLNQLIITTRAGQMDWGRVNPTTFSWTRDKPSPASLTIQRVANKGLVRIEGVLRRAPAHYVFEAFDLQQTPNAPQRQKLSISGLDVPDVNGKLLELYDTVSSSVSQKGLDFLKSVIPK